MTRPEVLPAFSDEERELAKTLLASRVASMMGRKFEEGDWAFVYCHAKGIPNTGWSNLEIDVVHQGLGIEHKMLCRRSRSPIRDACGTTLMHPAATRSIRIPSIEDPTEAAADVLAQYADLIDSRRARVGESGGTGGADLRTGWLLWQESLDEFLYFEEELLPPNPDDYYAEWRESGGGRRRKSRNLWVYEKATDQKRYSITTKAGAKIQPYFDVPSPGHPYLYHFVTQGEEVNGGLVRVWLTSTTAELLKVHLGSLEPGPLSELVRRSIAEIELEELDDGALRPGDKAVDLLLDAEVYSAMKDLFDAVSDEHMFQLLLRELVA